MYVILLSVMYRILTCQGLSLLVILLRVRDRQLVCQEPALLACLLPASYRSFVCQELILYVILLPVRDLGSFIGLSRTCSVGPTILPVTGS
jgi:hypothetical protein